jgi:hypothetical protein
MSSGGFELIPGRLLVGEVHGPLDRRIVRSELAYNSTLGVESEDAESRRLTLHGSVRVL